MCGRYTLSISLSDLEGRFECSHSELDWQPRYNIAPTQNALVVIRADKHNLLKEMKWGLIPHWAKDPSIGQRMINARLETLDQKPAFKHLLIRKRCIIPADGFYEWQTRGKSKAPYRILAETGDAFGFAGLWDSWTNPTGSNIDSFTIVTCDPVDAIRSIHNRMPLILPSDLEKKWLEGPEKIGPQDIKKFLALMHPEIHLRAYRVSPLVNRPDNDRPECIAEVPDEE